MGLREHVNFFRFKSIGSISAQHEDASRENWWAERTAADRGATLLEASFALTLVLLVIVFMIDVGRILLIQNAVNRAADTMVNTAKLDFRFASETRPLFGASNASRNQFMTARTAAINSGLQAMSSVAYPSNAGSAEPRLLAFNLPNFNGGNISNDAALVYPGQEVTLNKPGGVTERYPYIRMDRVQHSHCRQANPDPYWDCECSDVTTCQEPELRQPGSGPLLTLYRRYPPMALVAVTVQPLMLLRLFQPTITVVGRAYAAPERAPFSRFASRSTLRCGSMFWWGGPSPCSQISCNSTPGGELYQCALADANTLVELPQQCGSCAPATCLSHLDQGGTGGYGWNQVFDNIESTCRAQSGTTGDASQWSSTESFGDLTSNIVQNDGTDHWAQCVVCRKPRSCLEAYHSDPTNAVTAAHSACPLGQTVVRADLNYFWTEQADISVEACFKCDAEQSCSAVNPAQPGGCSDPVFNGGKTFDPGAANGGCWTCEGTCGSSTTVAAACPSCNPDTERCELFGSVPYSSANPSACCSRRPKLCHERTTGAGTCTPATCGAGKKCEMVGTPSAGCSASCSCEDTNLCAGHKVKDSDCDCQCPFGNAVSLCGANMQLSPDRCECFPTAGCKAPVNGGCLPGETLYGGGCCVGPH